MEWWWNPHHHSTLIPCGFHMDIPYGMMEWGWNMTIPGGFHMEYKWNGMTKMSGIPAKTYSIWNGWNPPGITWIPCGIWGQGKDLLIPTLATQPNNLSNLQCLVQHLATLGIIRTLSYCKSSHGLKYFKKALELFRVKSLLLCPHPQGDIQAPAETKQVLTHRV
jgi:hypothetical protein